MKWLIAVFLLSAAVSAETSQPPIPGKREARKNEQAQTSSQNATPERAEPPAAPPGGTVVPIDNQPATDRATGEPDQEGTQGKSNSPVTRWYKDWGNWSDIIAAASAVVMAVFAWLLWVVSDQQRQTLDATLRATIDIERAYIWVKFGSPGVSENGNTSIRVINTGNTPATVTDIAMAATLYQNIGAVPSSPDYASFTAGVIKHGQGSRAFLVKDEFISMPFVGKRSELIAAQNDSSLVLVMFGFVDYMDKFGVRHRTGFGRFFVAERDVRTNYGSDEDFAKRLNLGFLPKPGYNYDRVRLKGEGDDWT